MIAVVNLTTETVVNENESVITCAACGGRVTVKVATAYGVTVECNDPSCGNADTIVVPPFAISLKQVTYLH